jgi:hypothetical protein
MLLTESNFLPESMGVDELRLLYPEFTGIYERHVDDAKLDTVKKAEFRSLKERLVRHLPAKYPELAPGMGVSSGNLQRAPKIFPKTDKNNQPSLWSKFTRLFSWSKDSETEVGMPRTDLDAKMMITSSISDSEFLQQLNLLKGVDDKDLEAAIQTAVELACGQLSSSIDRVVKKMGQAVSRMRQGEHKRSLKLEIETKERKELGDILANFVQAINRASSGRRTS